MDAETLRARQGPLKEHYRAEPAAAQVTLRALNGEYESLDEVMTSLHSVLERNPPVIEPRP